MEPQQLAEWQEKYRVAVQQLVDEPVQAAWVFYRTGGYASLGLREVSPILAWGATAIGKRKAGGLPNQFVLAVTPTRVHAFKYSPRGYDVKLGKELAVWERRNLRVTSEEASINTTVTLESAAEGEKIVCSTGKDEASMAIVRALQTPVMA